MTQFPLRIVALVLAILLILPLSFAHANNSIPGNKSIPPTACKLQKNLYAYDKPLYNKVLKVVNKLFDDVAFQRDSHGGPLERVLIGHAILNELVHIHRSYAYCSAEKKTALCNLYEKAYRELNRLNRLKKERNSPYYIPYSFLDRLGAINEYIKEQFPHASTLISLEQARNLVQHTRNREIDTVGGNIAFMCFGVGAAVGRSKTSYGGRKCVVAGQWVFSHVCSAMIGKYHTEKRKGSAFFRDDYIWDSFWKKYRWGFIVAFTTEHNSYEGVQEIGVGFHFIRCIYQRGLELFKLPPDLRTFRECIGLTPSNGVMPREESI